MLGMDLLMASLVVVAVAASALTVSARPGAQHRGRC